MAKQSKKQDMGSGSIPGLMMNLAVPAVVAQLINMLYNIVDILAVPAQKRPLGFLRQVYVSICMYFPQYFSTASML